MSRIKRLAAIHDLSGFGSLSLTAAIPVLSTMGVHVCPLPTAVLSSHTQYPGFTFLDLTDEMNKIIGHWEKLSASFDAIYSGYLGSPQQTAIVSDFIDRFRRKDTLVVVDPVLGDNGRLYATMTQAMVDNMRELAKKADVLTPNLTEAFALLGRPYKPSVSLEELADMTRDLARLGPKTVVITSATPTGPESTTSVFARDTVHDAVWFVECPYLPAHFPGTGDTFTSVVTGSLMRGETLPVALERATQFILCGIRRAIDDGQTDFLEGIPLEAILDTLSQPTQATARKLAL